jgi:hypothetical protein
MREAFAPEQWTVDVDQLVEARRRFMRAGYSALFRCVEAPGVGMRSFLEVADRTQRELVGRTARDFYAQELGLANDDLDTFFGVTNVGVVGSGFDYEVNRHSREDSVSAEQYRCPLIDHAKAAGYPVGHPALADMSLWCDTYDNFESAAVAPSTGMVHSHCLGRGDHQCRWYIETLEEDQRRRPDEHIFDYLARMRDRYRAADPGGPWVIDGLEPDEIDRITRENVALSEADQDKLYPSLEDKLTQGVLVSSRIAASSIVIAAKLLGWDRLIEGMAEKEGPILRDEARKKADQLGIYGATASAARWLHEALNLGTGVAPYEIEELTTHRVVASTRRCPLAEAAQESGLGEDAAGLREYHTAVARYECEALGEGVTMTFTHCISRGDAVCRYVAESGTGVAGAAGERKSEMAA